ncbi:class I SAM-dependent methyltransferase [Luteolibacter soli]|uniref:Class I SAM-dependent methyltransferase n=1 Tax=Luteolibacter soli TaxID=3135280 RepID=A0ABU9AW45_9BACT
MSVQLSHPAPPFNPKAEAMLSAIGGFPISDRQLFLAGYSELCRVDLTDRHAVEICGASGKLAAAVARTFPGARVTGLDLWAPSGPEPEEWKCTLPGLELIVGDAFDLSAFPAESVDLVWGQAALHHLSHDLDTLCREVTRILKPGGRLVFVFEPMGHNLAVAAIRAMRMAVHEMGDESNLYISQFKRMSAFFSTCEVQMFNLLGYPVKALSDRFGGISHLVHELDARLFGMFPRLLRYGANANVILTK